MEPPERTGAGQAYAYRKATSACRQAAEKVASFLNTRITKTGINYCVLFFNPRHLFFDDAGRIYTVHFDQKAKGYFVLVEPTEETGKNEPAFSGQKLLVRQKSIIIYTNFNLIAEYLFHFLKKRNYPVKKTDWTEIITVFRLKVGRGTITAGPFSALIQTSCIRNRLDRKSVV